MLPNGRVINVARSSPRNKSTRAERVASWNEAVEEARRFAPRRLAGEKARYEWIRAVIESSLPAMTRLIAHTLALHGTAGGKKIFPSVRTIAAEAGTSARCVSEHVDTLVRRGFVLRQARFGDTAGGRGFEYLLTVPTVFTQDQYRHEQIGDTRVDAGSTQATVCTQDQHGVHPDAESVDGKDTTVLTLRLPSIPSSVPKSGARGVRRAIPAGSPERGRIVETDEVQHRRRMAEALASGATPDKILDEVKSA